MRKLGQIGGTSFLFKLRGVSVKQLRSWIGLRTDTISRFLSLTFNKLLRGRPWADMANVIMQLHDDLVSLMEECTDGFEIVRNIKTEVWRRLNHKYDPRNPLRNSCWSGCSRRRKLAILTRLQAWRDSSKSCEWFARDLAMMCRTSGNRYTWCASRRSVRRSSVLTLLCRLRPLTP